MLPASIAPSALPGADHRVDLVDEDDGLAFVLRHFLQHALQAFLELAAELRAGEQQRHVEHQHALVLQRIGHLAGTMRWARPSTIAVLPTPGSPISTGCSSCAAAAPGSRGDLVVAADHRIELAEARALGQVEGVFLQSLALALGVGAVDLLASAHRVDRRLERLAGEAMAAHDAAEVGLRVGQRQQEHLAGNELIAALAGFLLGRLQQCGEFAARLHDLSLPCTCGRPLMAVSRRSAVRRCWHRHGRSSPSGRRPGSASPTADAPARCTGCRQQRRGSALRRAPSWNLLVSLSIRMGKILRLR
jgi:hypothetical protein